MADSLEFRLIQRNVPDPVSQKRREDRENGRQQAQQYALEALQEAITVMRQTKDESIKLKAAKMVMDRAWGTPKAMEDEDKLRANRSIIDVLAEISSDFTALEAQKRIDAARAPKIEDTRLLDDIEYTDFLPGDGQAGAGDGDGDA